MRELKLHIAMLTLFAVVGMSGSGDRPLPPSPSLEEAVAALPAVSAPPPAAGRTLSEMERAVLAQLQRYARRTGLTEEERVHLARVVVREARRHTLDPALVVAVMHVESRYDAFAVSNKDAMGLMQILPSTGAWLAPQVGVEWHGPQTLFDPESNVRLGVAYLRQLADRYDGDVATALAAYNWGPGAIDRFLARGRPLPREYAQLVLAAYVPEG